MADAQFARTFPGLPLRPSVRELLYAGECAQKQLRAYLAAFYRQMRDDRHTHSMRMLASFWPVSVGLLLGAYALELRELVACYASWAVPAVFPFAALAGRLEILTGGSAVRKLSLLMLYAQFPLEGMLVRIILKRRVTVSGVCKQISCLHILALAQLWLVSGPLSQVLAR